MWPRQNFSFQYQYNIKQTSDENKEKYWLGDYWLIKYQILKSNITRIMWQTVRRIIQVIITNEILEVKGLIVSRNSKWYWRERKTVLETFYVKWNFVMNVNPLITMSDQERIFPYNINWYNINQMSDEIKDKYCIILGIISWSNTKFSELTL